MKNILLTLLLCTISTLGFGANNEFRSDEQINRDLKVLSLGKEKPRTHFTTFKSAAEAAAGTFETSPYYLTLTGEWDFFYSDDARLIPEEIVIPGAEIEWKSIRVPGNWEFQGFGEALYVNQPYEFEPYHPKAPVLPDVIPMGVYHRTFTIPEEWAGRRIYLNFDAVKSGVFVYLNGRRVGYSEDSKDRAQFCINDFVKEGENDLVVKCYRWSTGSWLECQDFWRVSGIERDVYLCSESKDSIFDFDVVSTLDETCSDGLFKLQIAGGDISKVSYKLLDASGKTVLEGVPGQDTIRIPSVRFWSAETPELYTLIIRDHDEYIPFKVGFVRYEFLPVPGDDSHIQFCVNGKPVIYKGVNLHETDSETGHYVTEEDLRWDFELMLSMNINAVRTSHYPQSRRFYELAAEYGIYVYNEANIESHGMGYNLAVGGTLANNPAFLESHLDRIEALYNTTRNYPCVNIWSLGNEAGNGYNMYQAYLWLKQRDPSRPVTYERAQWEWNADIYTRQYPDAPWYEEMGRGCKDSRPLIVQEYNHSTGNSSGGLWDVWKHIYKYPNLQGGYIWDWADQAIKDYDENGRLVWKFGGDYGVLGFTEGNGICDGIVNGDREPQPGTAEVKYCYSDVAFYAIDAAVGEFEIENRFFFTAIDSYPVKYEILENGKRVFGGSLYVKCAPQQKARFSVPMGKKPLSEGKDCFVNFSIETPSSRLGLPKGSVIASEQIPIRLASQPYLMKGEKSVTLEERDGLVTLSCKVASVSFDKTSGNMVSYKYRGKELLCDSFGIRPNFWRAPTTRDYRNGSQKKFLVWKNILEEDTPTEVKVADKSVTICYSLGTGCEMELAYTMDDRGALHIDASFDGKGADENLEMYRVGVRFRLPSSQNSYSYYGRGPQENYCDRKMGTFIGKYSTTAEKEHFIFMSPMETGHHTDTRLVEFPSLALVADDFFEFNAIDNSVEDLDWGWFGHTNEVPERNFVEVCIDKSMSGIGGQSGWGVAVENEYHIKSNAEYSLGFALVPMP